jgi:hypothetical protein
MRYVVCYPEAWYYVGDVWPDVVEDLKAGEVFDPGWLLTARRDSAQEFATMEDAVACVLLMESQTTLKPLIVEADKAVL